MKVLLINGSSRKAGCTFTALSEIAAELEKQGIESVIYQLGTAPVQGCIACGGCKRGDGCKMNNDVNALAELMKTCDGLIVGSPVYYAGPNGALCALLDRFFYSHGGEMTAKPAAAIVSCRRGGASAAFDRLNKYFSISNMPIVTSQYWNQVHGSTPDDVRKDEEGLQTMRTLAVNMAHLLRMKAAAALPAPAYEPKCRTNFIR